MEALFLYRSMEKQTKEQFIEKARLVHILLRETQPLVGWVVEKSKVY